MLKKRNISAVNLLLTQANFCLFVLWGRHGYALAAVHRDATAHLSVSRLAVNQHTHGGKKKKKSIQCPFYLSCCANSHLVLIKAQMRLRPLLICSVPSHPRTSPPPPPPLHLSRKPTRRAESGWTGQRRKLRTPAAGVLRDG